MPLGRRMPVLEQRKLAEVFADHLRSPPRLVLERVDQQQSRTQQSGTLHRDVEQVIEDGALLVQEICRARLPRREPDGQRQRPGQVELGRDVDRLDDRREAVQAVRPEALALGMLGGGLGVLLAQALVSNLANLPYMGLVLGNFPGLAVSPAVAAIAFTAAVVLGVSAGLVPAMGAYRAQITDMLRQA